MVANKSVLMALTVGVCAAVIYAVGRKALDPETKQLKADLGTWDGEGGNPAPASAQPAPRT